MRLALIVNTASVNASGEARLERALRTRSPEAILLRTREAGDAARLARHAIESGMQRIVLAGGDGTVHEAANAAIGSQVELAVVPCGTGNDFSRSLGIPRDLEGALEVALRGSPRATDAGELECTGADGEPVRRVFVNIAEAGMGAQVVRRARYACRFLSQRLAYQFGILAALASLRLAPVRISVDGELLGTFPNSNLIVGNGGYFGCGLRPLPQACLDDGLLDIAHIRDASRIEMALEARELKNGIRPDHPKVDQRRCRILHAESDEYVGVEADGELLGRLPATFKVLPRALRFVHAG